MRCTGVNTSTIQIWLEVLEMVSTTARVLSLTKVQSMSWILNGVLKTLK
jgi:hypothetical protein